MSIYNTISKSKLNYQGLNPESMAIVPDTIHDASSVYGDPSFSSYKQSWLRKLKPTKLGFPKNPSRYLDHLPK